MYYDQSGDYWSDEDIRPDSNSDDFNFNSAENNYFDYNYRKYCNDFHNSSNINHYQDEQQQHWQPDFGNTAQWHERLQDCHRDVDRSCVQYQFLHEREHNRFNDQAFCAPRLQIPGLQASLDKINSAVQDLRAAVANLRDKIDRQHQEEEHARAMWDWYNAYAFQWYAQFGPVIPDFFPVPAAPATIYTSPACVEEPMSTVNSNVVIQNNEHISDEFMGDHSVLVFVNCTHDSIAPCHVPYDPRNVLHPIVYCYSSLVPISCDMYCYGSISMLLILIMYMEMPIDHIVTIVVLFRSSLFRFFPRTGIG
jgi:hypothetical protein